jgi:hypothetical protein
MVQNGHMPSRPATIRVLLTRISLAALAPALLAACVYLPETRTVYNAECGIFERRVSLEAHQVASIMGCRGEACVAALAVAGIVSATTAVVSGSVVVVGKVVYWLEKQGQCLAAPRQQNETRTVPP